MEMDIKQEWNGWMCDIVIVLCAKLCTTLYRTYQYVIMDSKLAIAAGFSEVAQLVVYSFMSCNKIIFFYFLALSNRQLTGCWQVRNQSTLQRLHGKITNIPPTTRNYSLFLQCNATQITTSPLLYISLSVFLSFCLSVILRSRGHNFYSILTKLDTDLWSLKCKHQCIGVNPIIWSPFLPILPNIATPIMHFQSACWNSSQTITVDQYSGS